MALLVFSLFLAGAFVLTVYATAPRPDSGLVQDVIMSAQDKVHPGCTDFTDCTGCTDCTDCQNCADCKDCKDCLDCLTCDHNCQHGTGGGCTMMSGNCGGAGMMMHGGCGMMMSGGAGQIGK